MQKLPRAAGRWVDVLHKGFVLTCVGVTLYGMVIVGARTYNYFTYIKPQREEERRRLEAATENKNFEADSPDIALTLKT